MNLRALILLFLVSLCLGLLSFNAKAGDWWLTVPYASQHKKERGNGQDYNEENKGIGFEYKQNVNVSWTAFTYPNSYYRRTYAGAVIYCPDIFQFQILELSLRGCGTFGFASGYFKRSEHQRPGNLFKRIMYDTGHIPVYYPVIQIEAFKLFGADILVSPEVAALAWKFNF